MGYLLVGAIVIFGLGYLFSDDDAKTEELPRNTSGWWNVNDYFEKKYKYAYEPTGLYAYLVKEYGKHEAVKIMKNEYGLVR